MQAIDLSSYKIKRPEKIGWYFPSSDNVLDTIKSKSLRHFLNEAEEKFKELKITVTDKEVSKDEYLNWLQYYQQRMKENNYDIFATPEWYDTKTQLGYKIYGLFFHRDGRQIGSLIYTMEDIDRSNAAFKASDRLEELATGGESFGALIDYCYLRLMKEKNVATILYGRSRNAFGAVNKFSYLEYKLKFGLQPMLLTDMPLTTEVPVNEKGIVIFYGLIDESMSLYLLKPHGDVTIPIDFSRFSTDQIPYTIIEYHAH